MSGVNTTSLPVTSSLCLDQVSSAPVGDDDRGGFVSLHLLRLHPDVRRHVILDASAGESRVTPQVPRVVQVLQGVARQSVGRLSLQLQPVLGGVHERTPLWLRRVRRQFSLHVVFGERPGDSVRAGAAESRQRSRAGGVLVSVVWAWNFNDVFVMQALSGEVDAGGPRSSTHNAGHVELGVVGQRGSAEARAVSFGES